MRDSSKKIFEAIGLGGLVAGNIVITILHIIIVWGTGVGMVLLGIAMIFQHSVLPGLLVLFIGTPVAVAISEFLFPFMLILIPIGLIIIALIRWIF